MDASSKANFRARAIQIAAGLDNGRHHTLKVFRYQG
jgi:hypothetical protein